ncbi:MAG: hypothetical protein ACFE9L_13040 [Candidatus Hodarchaeota archaeon]
MKTNEIREGLGTFLISSPRTNDSIPRRSDDVFFNPHQEINRDLSVLTLRAYSKINEKKKLTVCEPLCGSGIRSCRYALETPSSEIYCNDFNPNAVEVAQKNIERLPNSLAKKINLFNIECNEFLQKLYVKHMIFDFIDIDPFGTPIPFVQNSTQLINVSGLLAFTATDLASLVGLYPRALYAKYSVGQFDARIGNIHEIAARALITGIQHVGLTLNQSLIPVLTFYHRHFIRTFLIRKRGVDQTLNQTGFISFCPDCQTRFTKILGEKNFICPICSKSVNPGLGPLYLGSIQNKEYLVAILQDEHLHRLGTQKKLSKVIPLMLEETSIGIPWSFDIPKLAKKIGVPVPPLNQVSKILTNKGFQSSKTHFSGTSLKTNADETELLSIIYSLKLKRTST